MTPDDEGTEQSLPDFVERVYANDGVSQLCIELQDDYGVDVPVLLGLVWAVTQAGFDDPDLATILASTADAITAPVVRPLRDVRRRLRDEVHGVPDSDRAQLHQHVLDVEIAAERAVLRSLDFALRERPQVTALPDVPRARLRALAGQLCRLPAADHAPLVLDSRSRSILANLIRSVFPDVGRLAVDAFERTLAHHDEDRGPSPEETHRVGSRGSA